MARFLGWLLAGLRLLLLLFLFLLFPFFLLHEGGDTGSRGRLSWLFFFFFFFLCCEILGLGKHGIGTRHGGMIPHDVPQIANIRHGLGYGAQGISQHVFV